MAPTAIETITVPVIQADEIKLNTHDPAIGDYKELSPTRFSREEEIAGKDGHAGSKYPHYLPAWNPDEHYPPLVPFEHYEHGKDADTTYPELLPKGVSKRVDLTPSIGSEVSGIQLSSLSNAGKDQLARFVAERKVVAFRKQDFADLPIQEALDYAGYFGRHHIHPTSGAPPGYPEIHIVHRAASDRTAEEFFKSRTNSVAWHSDVSYELQPPGTTFLYILDNPEVGGDTLFTDGVEAYNRLSPEFQKRLHGLKATHSGIEQVNSSVARGSIKRREPVLNVHPIVRTHPATGEKALYVNPQCKLLSNQSSTSGPSLTKQSPAILSATRRRSRTHCSTSCTATWPWALTSRPASSGRRAQSSSGTTV